MAYRLKNAWWEGFELTVSSRSTPRGQVEMRLIDAFLLHGPLNFDEAVDAAPNDNDHYKKRGWDRQERFKSPKRAYVNHVLRDLKRAGTLRYERPYWSLAR